MSFCCNKSTNNAGNQVTTEKQDRFYLILGLILMLSEIWKQYTLTFVLNDGEYQWSYIPFQLCSVPMYLCLFLGLSGCFDNRYSEGCKLQMDSERIKNAGDRIVIVRGIGKNAGRSNTACSIGNKTAAGISEMIITLRRACMVFLADYTLMSGVVTFLDTSGLHYGYAPLTIHSYLWHIIIAGIGVYSGLNLISCDAFEDSEEGQIYPTGEKKQFGSCRKQHLRKKQLDCFRQRLAIRDFVPASCIFLIGCGIAEIINLSFDRYGIVNMFYINPHYYVNQIVFNELAHIIPNNIVIVLYIICAMLAAFIVHLAWMEMYRLRLGRAIDRHLE